MKRAIISCALFLAITLAFAIKPICAEAEDVQPAQNDTSVEWKSLLTQSLFFLGIQQAYRIGTEPGTRDELKGPFLRDYFHAVGQLHGWSDGDPFLVNYVGHPVQGSVVGFMFVQNDPGYRRAEFGKSATYWKSRLRATAYSWAFSELFEIGPVSEASIGNIQSYYPAEGFVDHVMTPAMGMVWMIAEDAVDKYVIKRFEADNSNKLARILVRSLLNPTRGFSSMMAFKPPWERYTRPGVGEYDPNLWAIASKRKPTSGTGVSGSQSFLPSSQPSKQGMEGGGPKIAPFELTAYYNFSHFSHGGGNSGNCSGVGASGVFQLNRWLGAVIDVSGCKLSWNDPNITGDSLTYLFGPRFSFHQGGRWTFYTDLLVGGNKLTQDHYFPERVPTGDLTEWNNLDAWVRHGITTESTDTNGFAMAIGGGIDLKVRRGMAIQLGNVQFVRTTLNEFHDLPFSSMFRFTTGFVLRAGEL